MVKKLFFGGSSMGVVPPNLYLNCRGDAFPHQELASPHRYLGAPPLRFERCIIRQKRPYFSPNFGEKPLQFSAKTFSFFFCVHSISVTEIRNLHQSTFACQMRLVKTAKASPHAKFYNLSTSPNHVKIFVS